jgi:hypothetical protein
MLGLAGYRCREPRDCGSACGRLGPRGCASALAVIASGVPTMCGQLYRFLGSL